MTRENWFEEDPNGTLIAVEQSGTAGMTYYVWFPYARGYVRRVSEGSLVAVKSFMSTHEVPVYSILEIVSALPVHYALGSSAKAADAAFPGFVVEAAKSARQDWEQTTSEEETTRIRTEAIPTNLQLRFESGTSDPQLEIEELIPMQGEDAFLLTSYAMNCVINHGLLTGDINTIRPCWLVLNPDLPVHIDVEKLASLHFGIFGFTGAGKSNLTSTLISSIIQAQANQKIALFDLMDEYLPLLIDIIANTSNAFLVALDRESLPGGDATVEYLLGDESKLDQAAEGIARTMLLPRELAPYRNQIRNQVGELLQNNKFRVYAPGIEEIHSSSLEEQLRACISGYSSGGNNALRNWIDVRILAEDVRVISQDHIQEFYEELSGYLASGDISIVSTDDEETSRSATLGSHGETSIRKMIQVLRAYVQLDEDEQLPSNAQLATIEINRLINESDTQPVLLVFQSHKDDELRKFASWLVTFTFNYRKGRGRNTPPALFIFDEADEFIPQSPSGESYKLSIAASRLLARRGRKFGMGMGICTQRVAYLDTSILAQPHTYFVSKLPRAYDREAMANAFGMSDDMMRKTLRFQIGQWLLVSYDAVGLRNVPIPVTFPNANERVLEGLGIEPS
ncbi:MAG: ATP-binding protein [Candidatus Thorarchaeota archaeon]